MHVVIDNASEIPLLQYSSANLKACLSWLRASKSLTLIQSLQLTFLFCFNQFNQANHTVFVYVTSSSWNEKCVLLLAFWLPDHVQCLGRMHMYLGLISVFQMFLSNIHPSLETTVNLCIVLLSIHMHVQVNTEDTWKIVRALVCLPSDFISATLLDIKILTARQSCLALQQTLNTDWSDWE